MSSRRVRRAPLLIAAAGVLALTAACGGNSTTGSGQPSSSKPSTSTSKSTTTTAPKTSTGTGSGDQQLNVSADAATQLCDMLRPQLSDWRVQGPTLGKIAYNATVHEWAVRNGGINVQVLQDKDAIDRITTANCSDVRDQALSALEMPSMASGLAF
ncbi:hypothetical protein [Nocardia huaxiensis]|uniref:Uncharacterized protein n=1 Tax=Nocardia huaxiensis TaxID=2755382 RepID=A0A7D6Z5G4_9NOCA|nr:hypothetical protein [Nocardia huaxiensis]QLY33446.1 hypothetical protein H0264_15505 [Nocardia huaxiensis]UFS99643.1 hypothetical protein LPY97_18045 [Nocardia huaxiensis]